MASNLAVGLPLDIAILRRHDSSEAELKHRIEADHPYFEICATAGR
jgi:predicted proteasome-type protease